MYMLVITRKNGDRINIGPFKSKERAEIYAREAVRSVSNYSRHFIDVLVVPHCSIIAIEERFPGRVA